MSVPIELLDDRVLIKQHKAEETTPGGIVLPDAAKESPQTGEVMAVGPGKLLDSGERGALILKVGDTVYYDTYAGREVTIGGEDYVLCHEAAAWGVMPKK